MDFPFGRLPARHFEVAFATALEAGPAEVDQTDARGGRRREVVDLLPEVLADVADVELSGPRLDREAIRVAQPVGEDPLRRDVFDAEAEERFQAERVVRQRRPGFAIDADDRAAVVGRVTRRRRRAQVLRPQRSPFEFRVAAVVAELSVVDRPPAGPLAAAHQQRPFGVELDVTDGVAGRLLAPVVDQHFLRAGIVGAADGDAAARIEPRPARAGR